VYALKMKVILAKACHESHFLLRRSDTQQGFFALI